MPEWGRAETIFPLLHCQRTGYLLPGDSRAYWSTVVTIQISSLAPGAGEFVMRLLGSPDGVVGVSTFSRFYALHVLVLPALMILLIVLHVYLVLRHGVAPTHLAGKMLADAVAGDSEQFDVFSRVRHLWLPGGKWFANPALALGMMSYRLSALR